MIMFWIQDMEKLTCQDYTDLLQTKAELLREGIIFSHPFIFQSNFINEKVENGRN